jgi:catechol 2,3-dioxygenase-like lactoylglutathione lyase family enzyme
MLKNKKLRIARPSRNLAAIERFYCKGLGLKLLGKFEDHEGSDGMMLGEPGALYHFEFTQHRNTPIEPSPTKDDLIVFYLPSTDEWQKLTINLENNGFGPVDSLNPYWDKMGKTYQDPDGYRIVIQNQEWA